jgi:hypothetical protein
MLHAIYSHLFFFVLTVHVCLLILAVTLSFDVSFNLLHLSRWNRTCGFFVGTLLLSLLGVQLDMASAVVVIVGFHQHFSQFCF